MSDAHRSKKTAATTKKQQREDAKSPRARSRHTDSSSAVQSSRSSSSRSSSSYSDESSVVSSSPSRHDEERPRFDSRASWADSTRFDMGRSDSRASELSAKDFRLTGLGRSSASHGRPRRSDSRASRLSRTSSHASMSGSERGRQSSFVSNFGVTKGKKRKDSTALSTITENWNLGDDQFGSPFTESDAHGE